MKGINQSAVVLPHKGPVTRKVFSCYDVIMQSNYSQASTTGYHLWQIHSGLNVRLALSGNKLLLGPMTSKFNIAHGITFTKPRFRGTMDDIWCSRDAICQTPLQIPTLRWSYDIVNSTCNSILCRCCTVSQKLEYFQKKVARLRLYEMRKLKCYVKDKALFETCN